MRILNVCVHWVYHHRIKQASKANEGSFINLTDCVILFCFKSLLLNGYLTSLPWGLVNPGVKFSNVTSIMFALSATDLHHWTRFQISVFFLTYLHHVCVFVCEYIYAEECYAEVMSVCTLSLFLSFLSMWSFWWLLYINYLRIERTTSKIGFLSYVLIFWWPQMISVVCLYLTPIWMSSKKKIYEY